MKPVASPGRNKSTVSEKLYLYSRQTRSGWVTTTFLNLQFPCLYFDNSRSVLFHLRVKGILWIFKRLRWKSKSLILHTIAMGKPYFQITGIITGKNYNYIPMMLHQKCSETDPLDLSKYWPCITFSVHLEESES